MTTDAQRNTITVWTKELAAALSSRGLMAEPCGAGDDACDSVGARRAYRRAHQASNTPDKANATQADHVRACDATSRSAGEPLESVEHRGEADVEVLM